jgi:tryptophanyl-tRNA synthetase
MSKSAYDPSSRILLTDNPHEIHSKIKRAVTDSKRGLTWDPIERPGVSNLIRILVACEQEYRRLENGVHIDESEGGYDKEVENILERYLGDERAIQNLKLHVSEAIVEALRSPREQFERLRGEVGYLEHIAEDGSERAKELAEGTMSAVRKMVGLS